ncbi:Uncharacterised protein [Moraxella caprae]|uniref:Uncharacterized protein n=1 Tax=Moraxella caprae TaxID=90240 RepID=A0A378R145_9GAMM|nr:hypothetical protein [Moraxella caprae]STZ08962.1 Uncharacterised protein [Moraxella caprae]
MTIRIYKNILKTLVLTTVFFAVSTNADEPKNNAFKQLENIRAEQLNNATNDNIESFYLLYGLAYDSDDIITNGKYLYHQILNLQNVTDEEKEIFSKNIRGSYPALPEVPEQLHSTVFCTLTQKECFKDFIANKEHWQSLTNDNQKFITRYKLFLNKPPAVYLDKTYFPSYTYIALLRTQRLWHLELLQLNDKEKIRKELTRELSILKNQLKYSSDFLQKLRINWLIQNNLQVIIFSNRYLSINFDAINYLTTDEKSLKLPLAYEFMFHKSLMEKQIEKMTFNDYNHIDTYNGIANYFANQIGISEKSENEIGKYQITYQQEEYLIKINEEDNFTGFQLANSGMINYADYIQELNETNNIINRLPAKLGFPFAPSLLRGGGKPLWFDKLTTNGFPYFWVLQEV